MATKLVTIESPGKLNILGGLVGPITTPCKLDTTTIISLINAGKVVYEVNPSNPKEKVRLTRMNVLKLNFQTVINQVVNMQKVIVDDVIKSTDNVLSAPVKEEVTIESDNVIVPEEIEETPISINENVFSSNSMNNRKNKRR